MQALSGEKRGVKLHEKTNKNVRGRDACRACPGLQEVPSPPAADGPPGAWRPPPPLWRAPPDVPRARAADGVRAGGSSGAAHDGRRSDGRGSGAEARADLAPSVFFLGGVFKVPVFLLAAFTHLL